MHFCTVYFSFAQAGHRGTCLRPLHIFALLFALLCYVIFGNIFISDVLNTDAPSTLEVLRRCAIYSILSYILLYFTYLLTYLLIVLLTYDCIGMIQQCVFCLLSNAIITIIINLSVFLITTTTTLWVD